MSNASVSDTQDHIAKALDRARAGEDKELAQQVRDRGEAFAHLLNGTVRMTHIHHIDNKAFEAPLHELSAIVGKLHELLGLVQLVMVEDQVYINDIRLRLQARNEVAQELAQLWRRHEVGGVTIHAPLDPTQVRALVLALAAEPAPAHPRAALQGLMHLAGMPQVELQPVFRFVLTDEQAQRRGHQAVREVYALAAQAMGELWDSLALDRSPNPLPVRKLVNELVDMDPRRRNESLVLCTRDVRSPAHSRHSLQVANLAVLLGREIGLSEGALADLGVAATFHDGGYTADEDGYPPPFERHGTAGARQLLKQRGFHEARIRRLLVCLEHHRPFNDPRSSSLYARIVHIADDFDTLTRYRPAGPLLAPPDALGRMAGASGSLYDPLLLQAFVNRMGLYPPGSILELDDRSWVMSLSTVREPRLFDRPLTRLVRTPRGDRPTADEDIDLAFGDYDVQRVIRPESPP